MRRLLVATAVLCLAGCSFDTSGLGSDPGAPDAGASSSSPDAGDPAPDDMVPPGAPDGGVCLPDHDLCEDRGDLVCVDLHDNDRNCGTCGNRCGGDESCVEGRCDDDD